MIYHYLDSVALPGDLPWTDEDAWNGFQVEQARALSGDLLMTPWTLIKGRPITLDGTGVNVWISYADRAAIRALITPLNIMTLTLSDSRVLTVTWRTDGPAFESRLINKVYPEGAHSRYLPILRLQEVPNE